MVKGLRSPVAVSSLLVGSEKNDIDTEVKMIGSTSYLSSFVSFIRQTKPKI